MITCACTSGKPDERLFVIETDQQLASKYLVVGCNQQPHYPAWGKRR
jgi:hypothetical protein